MEFEEFLAKYRPSVLQRCAAHFVMRFNGETHKAIPIMIEIVNIFKCNRCGECCRTAPIELSDEEVVILCKHLNLSAEEFDDWFIDKNVLEIYLRAPCPFLSDNACTVYEARPLTCRLYPFRSDMSLTVECDLGRRISDYIQREFPFQSTVQKIVRKRGERGLVSFQEAMKAKTRLIGLLENMVSSRFQEKKGGSVMRMHFNFYLLERLLRRVKSAPPMN